jgi:hypothetical protein
MMTSIKGMIIINRTMINAIDKCDMAQVICTEIGLQQSMSEGEKARWG